MTLTSSTVGRPVRPTLDKALSQWFTPAPLAERLGAWLGVQPHWHVLEPSAGDGALIRPLLAMGCKHVTACELDPRWAAYLRHSFDPDRVTVIEGSYFDAPAPAVPYDLTVMNPPYEDLLDGKFLVKAWRESLRLGAVLRAHALHGVQRHKMFWRDVELRGQLTGLAFCSTRPKFLGGGGMNEISCVRLDRVGAGGACVPEWW